MNGGHGKVGAALKLEHHNSAVAAPTNDNDLVFPLGDQQQQTLLSLVRLIAEHDAIKHHRQSEGGQS